MKRKKLFLTLLFCWGCMALWAQQQLKFKVEEQGTQQPLEGIYISLTPNGSTKAAYTAVTDAAGEAVFNLEKQGVYHYQIIAVGYVTASGEVQLPQKETVKITLREDVMHLNDVVVTGSRTERPVKLSPITTQVLGGKALVDAGYSDLQHALQQETPGMNIQKVGFGNEISMQGLDARHVLFLQDGERMTGEMLAT